MIDRRVRGFVRYVTNFVFLDEVDERRSLDLDRLTLPVVQRQHEVKEVALAKVARRLFLEVCPPHAETKHTQFIRSSDVYTHITTVTAKFHYASWFRGASSKLDRAEIWPII